MDRYLRNRIIGGIVVGVVLMFVSQCVRAYPASTVCWMDSGQSIPCQASVSAAAQAFGNFQQGAPTENRPASPATAGEYFLFEYRKISPPDQAWLGPVYIKDYGAAPTCPNGGTLSGSMCTCGAGETDTGTSCTSPNPCAAHEIKLGGASGVPVSCTPKCPEGMHGGERLFPAGVQSACGAKGVQVDYTPDNSTAYKEPDGITDRLLQCRYKLTGVTNICAQPGAGLVSCYSSNSRIVGGGAAGYCPPASSVPATPESARQPAAEPTPTQADVTTCAAGDLWCQNTTGTCASGYVGGAFNGTSICVKQGESVTMQPQPNSPLNPPTGEDRLNPPTQTTPGQAPLQPGEGLTPADRVAVGIGGGANGPGGAGSGGTGSGSGGGDIITCGLPDTPKCKIDEAGTPDGKGTYDAATKAIDGIEDAVKAAAAKAGDSAGKDSSLGVAFGIPSGCTNPAAMQLPSGGTFVADFCQYQPQVHDIMSIVWLFFTSLGCIGMVRRTITGGG